MKLLTRANAQTLRRLFLIIFFFFKIKSRKCKLVDVFANLCVGFEPQRERWLCDDFDV